MAVATSGHAGTSSTVEDGDDVKRGDGYVIVYPESDVSEGESDFISTGSLSDDTLVIIADDSGDFPLGLSAEEITNNSLENGAGNIAGPERGSNRYGTIHQSAGHCFSVTGLIGAWSNPVESNVAVFGRFGHMQGYSYHLTPGTNQSAVGQGLAFSVTSDGVSRYWASIGSASPSSPAVGTVPWGNVAAQPQFRAQSLNAHIATGQWCH